MSRRSRSGMPIWIFVALLVSASAEPVLAQSAAAGVANDTIRLRRSAFSHKFAVGQRPEENVIQPWLGLKLREPFLDALSSNEEAVSEARRANPFLVMSTVGGIAFVAGSTYYLIDSLNSPGNSPAQLRENSTSNVLTDVLVFIALPGTVMIVGSVIANRHIGDAVRIFNEGLTGGAGTMRPAGVPIPTLSVRSDPGAVPVLNVGLQWKLR